MVLPDQNDTISFQVLMEELHFLFDWEESEVLHNTIGDVSLPERKILNNNTPPSTSSILPSATDCTDTEQRFRESIIQDYSSSCADSPPANGPPAKKLDGTVHKVKLRHLCVVNSDFM